MVTRLLPTIHYYYNWIEAHALFIITVILFILIILMLIIHGINDSLHDSPLSKKKLNRMSEERKNLARAYFEKHNEPITRNIIRKMEAAQKEEVKKRQTLDQQRRACAEKPEDVT